MAADVTAAVAVAGVPIFVSALVAGDALQLVPAGENRAVVVVGDGEVSGAAIPSIRTFAARRI